MYTFITKIIGLCYETYLSWINEFIKTSLKPINHNQHLEKIDLKQTLNKISLLLEDIDSKLISGDKGELNSWKQYKKTFTMVEERDKDQDKMQC